MQRNIAYKNFVKYALWSVVFALYTSLGCIYLFLPPMMAVLFLFFRRSLQTEDTLLLFFVLIDIFVLETQKGFLAFSVLIYFMLMQRFVVPKIDQSINVAHLRNFLYVFITYFGYIVFSMLLSQIFLIQGISIDYYIVYYITVEFLIVSVLA